MDGYDIIRAYRELRMDHFYPFDDSWWKLHPHLKDEILEKRKRLEALRSRLEEITIKQLKQCRNNLLMSIDKALELTAPSKLGYPLSRTQGLGIPNYIFPKVHGIIESAMNSVSGFGYSPIYLERDGDFDSRPMRDLLMKFRKQIEKAKPSSYEDLEALYDKFSVSFKELWDNENKLHPYNRKRLE